MRTPVVVIGTGISGLFTALKLADAGLKVTLLTKTSLGENNSRYAQGGIAAVLPQNTEDSLESHVQDTLKAGAGLCDESVVRSLLSEAYASILDLLRYGVPFDKDKDGHLALGQEAAHSTRRILHAGGDATGLSVELALIERLRAHPGITLEENALVTRLCVAEDPTGVPLATGCEFLRLKAGPGSILRPITVQASYTVLATGGVGQLYTHTTNPPIATGDGLTLAYHALQQCHPPQALADLEFLQFHPTAFYQEGQARFLISEAVRGEGAILKNCMGEAFAKGYHPDGELAPRDIVTRAIFAEMSRTQTDHVLLDMTHLPAETVEHRFPTILRSCLDYGIDPRKEPIPVAPAAHYMMGGVPVDLRGESPLKHLYVVGEAACTGLHGANRLASNSLLECVVLARRVAETIANLYSISLRERVGVREIHRSTSKILLPSPGSTNHPLPKGEGGFEFLKPNHPQWGAIHSRSTQLRRLMWVCVGIIRTPKGLQQALGQLKIWENEAHGQQWDHLAPGGIELVNRLVLGRLITEAALKRTQSCGAHFMESETGAANYPVLQG